MTEQQHYVLAQKLCMGRNKKGLMGLRSGKQSTPQSRQLLLWLLFFLTQGQSITGSDRGGILSPLENAMSRIPQAWGISRNASILAASA